MHWKYGFKEIGFTLFVFNGASSSDRRDRTESGHILGSPTRRGSPDMLDTKSMSPVPFNVVRMLTHMAMLFGTYSQPEVDMFLF